MEKFAVDLDKVLDEFEFNEDCAEQVAIIDESESHMAASKISQNHKPPTAMTTKIKNELGFGSENSDESKFHRCEDEGSANKESENTHRLRRVEDEATIQSIGIASETIDIRKCDNAYDDSESVNDFHKLNYQEGDKVQNKYVGDFRDIEPLSLTIHNDITQITIQKKHNDNTHKNNNSYDKKLNQPNIKPSVSNVFNSLNEYINASGANMECIDCSIDKNECSNSKNSSNYDKQIKDKKLTEFDEQECVLDSQTNKSMIKTSLPKYQNILFASKYDSKSSVDKDEKEQQNVNSNAPKVNLINESTELPQQSELPEMKNTISTEHTYENVDVLIVNNREIDGTIEESELKKPIISMNQGGAIEHVYENLDFGLKTLTAEKTMYERIYNNEENKLIESTTESDLKLKNINKQFSKAKSVSESGIQYVNPAKLVFETVDINPSKSEHKLVGFNTIDDLSEEELNVYLATLEAEERATEEKAAAAAATAIIEDTSIAVAAAAADDDDNDNDNDDYNDDDDDDDDDDDGGEEDEDANEAPIFENITIGELPCIPEEQLQRKVKKFPIIDYGKSGIESEMSGFLGKKDSEKFHQHVKIISDSKEKKVEVIEKHEIESITDLAMPIDIKEQLLECLKANGASYGTDFNTCNYSDQISDTNLLKDLQSASTSDNLNVPGDARLFNKSSIISQDNEMKDNSKIMDNVDEKFDNCKLLIQATDNVMASAESSPELSTNGSDSGADLLKTTGSNLIHTGQLVDSEENVDKPLRPQTLNIVATVNMDDHTTNGSNIMETGESSVAITAMTSTTTTTTAVATTQGAVTHDPSPDASDNSSMEFGIVLGKQPPFWVPDSDAPNCMLCDLHFNIIKRRHHCRACGKVLCSKCCGMKYRLEYQGNMDSRVCSPCYQQLIRDESEPSNSDWSTGYVNNPETSVNSSQGRQPNPNNPMEYCSTIPPLQQLAGGLPSPPTVMVPVGVLKREGSAKQRTEGQKSVIFSDGIRPGCDLTELDTTWDLKPPHRKTGNKRITGSGTQSITAIKRQNLPPLDPHTNSYIPQDANLLPPTVTIYKGQISYHEVVDLNDLYKSLKNEDEPPVMFAVNRNLYAYVKITNLNCCVNRICWCVTSRGLACVGQDEVILLIEVLPDESQIPKDLLFHINQLYIEATKGNTMTELGVSVHQTGNLLGSREHAGFLFIRQTFQCLQKIVLPPAPFLVGLLVHRWETPWAKVFPLRLVLRLGAEYRYYPCPLVSVRFRDAVYFEIGHTIMKVLADFRNYAYTLPSVRGLTIYMQDRTTNILFPRNRYDQVIKGLNNSNDHVLAFASNFSIHVDSHLVCIQTNTGDESSYQTQAINIHNKPREVTGASFVVINGALKSSTGLSAKSSIVEDGLMVQIMPEKMEALKAALKNMQNFSIGCGRQGTPEPDEIVNIKWVENDVQFNLNVKSPIDNKAMDGIPSIRVHNGTDYMGTSRFIRWTEVFIIKSDDHPNGVHDPMDINKLAEAIARATCAALVKFLDLLATAGLTKLGVRATIHPDNVGYEAGSESIRLPPIYMNSLDNELIQVLHNAAQYSQDTSTVLELIFHILDD